jgi:hypothetical protein
MRRQMLRTSRRCSCGRASTTESAVRAIAEATPPLSRYPATVSVRPSRRSHVAQRVRQQRERAGLGRDVAQDQLDEAGLELQAREPGGLLDGSLQLGGGHRSEQDLVGGHRMGQLGVSAEPPAEVGAQPDGNWAAQGSAERRGTPRADRRPRRGRRAPRTGRRRRARSGRRAHSARAGAPASIPRRARFRRSRRTARQPRGRRAVPRTYRCPMHPPRQATGQGRHGRRDRRRPLRGRRRGRGRPPRMRADRGTGTQSRAAACGRPAP